MNWWPDPQGYNEPGFSGPGPRTHRLCLTMVVCYGDCGYRVQPEFPIRGLWARALQTAGAKCSASSNRICFSDAPLFPSRGGRMPCQPAPVHCQSVISRFSIAGSRPFKQVAQYLATMRLCPACLPSKPECSSFWRNPSPTRLLPFRLRSATGSPTAVWQRLAARTGPGP